MDGAQAFSLFPVVTKSKAKDRLSYETTGRLKGYGEGMRFGCGSRSVLGPREEPSRYIAGDPATAGAWQWERREAGVPHVWVCAALTAGVCSGHHPAGTGRSERARNPLRPPSPSRGGMRAVGEEPKLLRIATVSGTYSFQGINGIRNEILALISHTCWVLSPSEKNF